MCACECVSVYEFVCLCVCVCVLLTAVAAGPVCVCARGAPGVAQQGTLGRGGAALGPPRLLLPPAVQDHGSAQARHATRGRWSGASSPADEGAPGAAAEATAYRTGGSREGQNPGSES